MVKLKTIGTPLCPELKVAVTVSGDPPAVKFTGEPVIETAIVVVAIVHSVKLDPL